MLIRDVGCAHPGFAPYLARIRCPKVRFVHPSEWPFWLHTSLAQRTLACIRFRNDSCMHPFSDLLKPNIWIQTSKTFIFTTGGLPGCKNKKDYSNRVPLSDPCLLREYTIDRKHSLCNLNPNDVTVRAILCCKNPAVKPKFPTFRSECWFLVT